MPKLVGAVSVFVLIVLTWVSLGVRVGGFRPPVPVFAILTIVFITSGSIFVSYITARAYIQQGLLSMLFVGSGALIFGSMSLLAALMAGENGSNTATTIFVVGALVSSALHLSCAASRFFSVPNSGGSKAVLVSANAAALYLVGAVTLATVFGAFPPFFLPGVGTTNLAKDSLVDAIATFGLAFLLIAVSSSRSSVLQWYSWALAMTAVGLVGILLSNGIFEAAVFWVGRTALCLGGVFLVFSVLSAGKVPGRSAEVRQH